MAPTLVGAPTGVGIPTGVGAWENEGKTSFSRRDTASGRAAGTGDRFAPWLVAGSGGSNRLRTAIAQFLSNVLDWRLPVREAVERPRLHFENDAVQLEGGYDPACADLLRARGYDVNLWSERSLYFGGTHVVMRTPDGLRGAGDPRRGGAVALVE
jgi:gamma-glutamyltranspeptidase